MKGKPFSIALEYWLYYLAQDPKWDWTTLTYAGFEQLWKQSVEQYGAVIGTDDPDLTRFRDRGGKVIIYHGLADQLIPAAGTIDYYKRVQQRMGGEKATAKFARLFLVPGVDHGFRGPGATAHRPQRSHHPLGRGRQGPRQTHRRKARRERQSHPHPPAVSLSASREIQRQRQHG